MGQTRRFSPHLYRAWKQVERFFNKHRYDRLAANHLAYGQLAWLRVNGLASKSLTSPTLHRSNGANSSNLRRDIARFNLEAAGPIVEA